MTGLAKVRGEYFTHPRDKLRYELLSIKSRSLLLDLELITLTLAGFPKGCICGPFSARPPLQPCASQPNCPTSFRTGGLVAGETTERPRNGRLHFAVGRLWLSAELSYPKTLAVSILRQMLEYALPLVKP
jgi:hypothetical protein